MLITNDINLSNRALMSGFKTIIPKNEGNGEFTEHHLIRNDEDTVMEEFMSSLRNYCDSK